MTPPGVVPAARDLLREGDELVVVFDRAAPAGLEDELVAAVDRLAVDVAVDGRQRQDLVAERAEVADPAHLRLFEVSSV